MAAENSAAWHLVLENGKFTEVKNTLAELQQKLTKAEERV